MRVAYVGNFKPPHSTENEVRVALESLGHVVERWQENDAGNFVDLATRLRDSDREPLDLVLWTRTGWTPPIDVDEQLAMLAAAELADVPTVGYHLDRWWGLNREPQIFAEPFFSCTLLCTADGGHQAQWAEAGIKHVWFPPAVSHVECTPGTFKREFASDIAFVGNWRRYHSEWPHRRELVDWLRRTYRARVKFWPTPGAEAVRGARLRDLYASTKVLVGDSCLVGGIRNYWSDRIPETLGRGGFLLHPYVDGLTDHFEPGAHLRCWPLGDFDMLREEIDWALANHERRADIAETGRAHVIDRHTYRVRMQQLTALMLERGLLRCAA